MKGEKQLSVGWILDATAFDSYHDQLAAAVTRNGHSVVSIKRPNPPYQWDDTGNSYRKAFPPRWDIFVNCSLKRSLRRHLIHPDSMVVSIGSTLLKYIVPRIALADLRVMLVIALVGGFVAGLYGIVHDQVTYSISPEYFTKLKFNQFSYANFGLGERVFASTIGFLATWWVGFIAAWFLGRRLIPNQPRDQAYRQIRRGITCIIAFGLFFGIAAYVYGLWRGPDADYSSWSWALRRFKITNTWAFVRVAYIHNAGYLGGLVGLVVALLMIRPVRHERDSLAQS